MLGRRRNDQVNRLFGASFLAPFLELRLLFGRNFSVAASGLLIIVHASRQVVSDIAFFTSATPAQRLDTTSSFYKQQMNTNSTDKGQGRSTAKRCSRPNEISSTPEIRIRFARLRSCACAPLTRDSSSTSAASNSIHISIYLPLVDYREHLLTQHQRQQARKASLKYCASAPAHLPTNRRTDRTALNDRATETHNAGGIKAHIWADAGG